MPRGVKRVRTGCWTCRRRGYRCDEGKPSCRTCLRLQIECEGYELRLKWMTTAPRDARASKSPASLSGQLEDETSFQFQESIPFLLGTLPMSVRPTKDLFLVQHFFYTVSGVLSSTNDRTINTYCRVILPMAHSCDLLLDSVLMVSAIHLTSRFDEFNTQIPTYRSRVYHGLIERIQNWQGFDVTTLATIIMLSIHEIFAANPEDWLNHLTAAGKIIAGYLKHCNSLDTSTKMLLDIFAYFNALASVMNRKNSLFLDCYFDNSWSALTGHRSAFLGTVDTILALVARLSMLTSLSIMPGANLPTRNIAAAQLSAAIALQEELLAWSPPSGIPDNFLNTAEAMRHAALLFFHKLTAHFTDWRGEVNLSIQTSCSAIIEHITRVPVDSPSVASHVWPLYMVGIFMDIVKESNTPTESVHERQHFIRGRLLAMQLNRGAKSIDKVRERLEAIWACSSHSQMLRLADASLILV